MVIGSPALCRSSLLHLGADQFGERANSIPLLRIDGHDHPRSDTRICVRRVPGQIETAAEEPLPLEVDYLA